MVFMLNHPTLYGNDPTSMCLGLGGGEFGGDGDVDRLPPTSLGIDASGLNSSMSIISCLCDRTLPTWLSAPADMDMRSSGVLGGGSSMMLARPPLWPLFGRFGGSADGGRPS